MVRHIQTDQGYDSDYPFSQGVVNDGVLYTAGQIPKDAETGEVVGTTIEAQTDKTFENLEAVLSAAGTDFEHVLKATAFLTDMDDYEGFNQVYREWVPEPHPGRSTVAVDELAIDIKVEIEMVAAIPE
jgi:2-iminobutanoate/2-iminopropanoate deaminase